MAATTSDGPPMRVVPVSMAAATAPPMLMSDPCIDMEAMGISQYSEAEGKSM